MVFHKEIYARCPSCGRTKTTYKGLLRQHMTLFSAICEGSGKPPYTGRHKNG